jgi:hypothetical protein
MSFHPWQARRGPVVQLADRDETSRAIIVVSVVCPVSLNEGVYSAADGLVGAAGLVVADHGCALAVVPHPRHEVSQSGVDDADAAEARVLAAGATKYDHQPGEHFRVYADPAGHPFCLCTEDVQGLDWHSANPA